MPRAAASARRRRRCSGTSCGSQTAAARGRSWRTCGCCRRRLRTQTAWCAVFDAGSECGHAAVRAVFDRERPAALSPCPLRLRSRYRGRLQHDASQLTPIIAVIPYSRSAITTGVPVRSALRYVCMVDARDVPAADCCRRNAGLPGAARRSHTLAAVAVPPRAAGAAGCRAAAGVAAARRARRGAAVIPLGGAQGRAAAAAPPLLDRCLHSVAPTRARTGVRRSAAGPALAVLAQHACLSCMHERGRRLARATATLRCRPPPAVHSRCVYLRLSQSMKSREAVV